MMALSKCESVPTSTVHSIAEQLKSKKAQVFLLDEAFKIVALADLELKQYTLQNNVGNFIACVVFSELKFSHACLFEQKQAIEGGSFIYRRSSFLPEMVQKQHFIQAFTNAFGDNFNKTLV